MTAPNVPSVQGAREARYAEAIEAGLVPELRRIFGTEPASAREFIDSVEELIQRDVAPGVMAVADAEVAAAVSEAQAEVARLRTDKATFEQWRDSWIIDMDTRLAQLAREEDRAESAEAEVERQAVLLRAINDCHDDPARAILQADKLAGAAIIRATVAEAEVERLREGIRALADNDDLTHWVGEPDGWMVSSKAIRALLAPSPAATTGEATDVEAIRAALMAQAVEVKPRSAEPVCCGDHDDDGGRPCNGCPERAPVSSGEAETGEAWERHVSTRCPRMREHGGIEVVDGKAIHLNPHPCPDCYSIESFWHRIPWDAEGSE